MKMNNKYIGVFDSGLGGLTAVKELINILPDENIVYFGDTGRVPYGTRSEETLIKYTNSDINFLKTHDIKLIVIACGTVSSVVMEHLNEELKVIGVVEPTSIKAKEATKNKKIGIIGTNATVKSKKYEETLKKLDPSIKTVSAPCPLFVPFVENGMADSEAAYLVAKEYLEAVEQGKSISGSFQGKDLTLLLEADEAYIDLLKYVRCGYIKSDSIYVGCMLK
jgi:glutamate racemase